jgi:hypothetical protein
MPDQPEATAAERSVAEPSSAAEPPSVAESSSAAESSSVAESPSVAESSGDGNKLTQRPFRVKLRGSVLALVRLPNRRDVRAAIHQLSVTGGVVHLEKPLDEKLEVQLIFHLQETTIREKAQMLFPMWATQGWMQPFRFVGLSDASRETLDANLKAMIGDGPKGAAAGA